MPLFSDQQTTHLQRTSNTGTATILRASADYAPAPSSGGSISELASLNRQQSAKISNGYNISRNAATLLSPRANPSIMRSVSIDSDVILPTHNNNKNINSDHAPQKPRRTSIMRAAESGKGSLLPMRGVPTSLFRQQQQQPQKEITRQAPRRSNSSGPGLPRTQQDLEGNSGGKSKMAYLRRRTANASSDDEFDSSSQRVSSGGNRRQRQSSAMSVGSTVSVGGTSIINNGSSSREHSSPFRWGKGVLCQHQLIKISRMKLAHLLQIVIVLAVIALVYESHQKADDASNKLLLFKEEESLLLLHLQKIEQQSIQLHTVLGQLAEMGGGNFGGDRNPGGEKVDIDLIHEQKKQLKTMEKEVSSEVENLQKRIQLSARNHIIQEFGEGPVQVVLELDLGDATENAGPHRITILLWHDTPHAAWTWLEQIGNNVWDGAEFNWHTGHTIDAVPPKDRVDPDRDGQIEFVEHSQHEHTDWTVGIREQPANGSGRGSMSMYINLRDNSQLHKYETCVGKVVDGFDALQKLLELSRNNGNGDQQDESSSSSAIKIRKATAEHYVTKKAGMGK